MSSSSLLVMEGEEERKGRRILVAVDGSDESMHALSWCLANFISDNPDGVSGDTLVLLYAKPRPAVYTAMDGTGTYPPMLTIGHITRCLLGYLFSADIMATTEKYNNRVAESVMEKAKSACREYGDVKVEMRVEDGDAKSVICRVAEKLSPDVLVIGSHGYGAIKRAMFGSVSYHCAQHVQCPVLVVKKPKSTAHN